MMQIKEIMEFAKHYNILIVDDDESILQEMKKLLENFQFNEIFTASNGEEAMKVLQNHQIDLVFTDLKMPKVDGIELLLFTKTLKKEISVIIITAYTDTEDLINLIKVGADGFIVKPIVLENFLEILSKELIKLHNRDYVKAHSYMNLQKAKSEEVKAIIIDILSFCDEPMFAKEKDKIFFINDKCFDKYRDNIDEKKFLSKKLINEITVYKEKNGNHK